jgi:hypothetical protein
VPPVNRVELLQWLEIMALSMRGGAAHLRAEADRRGGSLGAVCEGQAQGLEIAATTLEDLIRQEHAQ